MTMTDLDDRLARLGTHLDDERRARRSVAVDRVTVSPAAGLSSRARTRRLALTGAAAALLVALVVSVALSPGSGDTDLTSTGTGLPAPAPPPVGAPQPGTLAPYAAEPPDWFGDPTDGRRTADVSGRWTSTAIGIRHDGGRVEAPIWVGVTDGSRQDLDQAQTVVLDGAEYRSVRHGAWQALASVGPLTVVASGAVDTGTLVTLVRGARTGDTTQGLSLRLARLPAGYVELVAPQRHAEPAAIAGGRTLAGTTGRTGVSEVSEWVQPELAVAAGGSGYERVVVGDSEGWTGVATFNPTGPLRSLVWSPEPGVVLEISTDDLGRTVDELVDLARQVRLVPAAEWDDLLSVAAWFDRPLLPSATATIDVVERLDDDRVLVTVRFPRQSELRERRPACWGLYAAPGRDTDRIGVLTEPAGDGAVGSFQPVGPGTDVDCPDQREGGAARFALPLPRETEPAGHHLCVLGRRPGGCVKVPNL